MMCDVKVNFMKTIIYFVMAFKVTSGKSIFCYNKIIKLADIQIVKNGGINTILLIIFTIKC